MNHDLAVQICGGLSHTSKMPGPSYGIPASACITGSKLRAIPGSTCSTCYACKGRYVFKNVKNRQQLRLESLTHPQWAEAIAYLIEESCTLYFRWHDSGDIQSKEHLLNIYKVAYLCPLVQFWLPTTEAKLVRTVAQQYGIPANLCIRVSAVMLDESRVAIPNMTRSVVTTDVNSVLHRKDDICPAPSQGNTCGVCRRCWDNNVSEVIYIKH